MVLRTIAAALIASLCLGCFITDELDKSMDLMEHPRFGDAPAKEEPAPAARTSKRSLPKVDPSAAAAKAKSWWQEKARTLGSEEIDESLVRCELRGKSQFMRREECRSRGGVPKRVGS